jgi:hypothetical protein
LGFVLPGVLGVPIGTMLLPHIDSGLFKIGIGVFLVAYTSYVLTRRVEFENQWGGVAADGVIGFAGGILGGLAGLSGVLLVVWTDIRGWSKEHRRGVIQIFNMTILGLAVVSHVISGLFTREVALAAVVALPGTIGGAWIGGFIYRRIADRSYSRVIMTLLFISGVILIVTSR